MSKLFKFWKWRIEVKLSKLTDEKKVEFLANELVKKVKLNVDPDCECVSIWVHKKDDLDIETREGETFSRINCKYIGK